MSRPGTIRTRFAPSPSGHLHVGGARTALFCWAFARASGGVFTLRIEDTDRRRSSEAADLAFREDLCWLGIGWDEGPEYEGFGGGSAGPYRQSERKEIYDRHFERLLADGVAYRAFETPEVLEAARAKARAEQRAYRYDRAALDLDDETVDRYLAEGRPHVVRVRVPDAGAVVVDDVVRGAVRVEADELDDFIIRKADGFPTYHFAVVVDDELMGVTHVLRGEEHLKNTIRHVLLQDAMGFARPVYAHLPLIFNPDGSKMSKRDKDRVLRRAVRDRGIESSPAVDAATWTAWLDDDDQQLDLESGLRLAAALEIDLPEIDIDDFRRAGYLPEVMVNYLALLGWSPGNDIEKFDRDFLCSRFALDRISKAPARFDRDKLLAFNLDAIQAMSEAEFVDRFREHVRRYHPRFLQRLTDEQFRLLAAANHERTKTLEDGIASCRFFILDDDEIVYQRTKAVRKALVNGDPNGYAHLEGIRPRLAELAEWTPGTLEETLEAYAGAEADGKLGRVAQPLRIAVSGGTISPTIYATLAILGRAAVLARVDRCLAHRENVSAST